VGATRLVGCIVGLFVSAGTAIAAIIASESPPVEGLNEVPWAAVAFVSNVATGVFVGYLSVRVMLSKLEVRADVLESKVKRHDECIDDIHSDLTEIKVRCATNHPRQKERSA